MLSNIAFRQPPAEVETSVASPKKLSKSTKRATKPGKKKRAEKGATRSAAVSAEISASHGAEYLRNLTSDAGSDFSGATTLATMLSGTEPLTREERLTIVRQALILLEQNYVHLPLKRAMHAVDPVQRLKLLLQEVEAEAEMTIESDLAFHNTLTDIFTSLRDLHTNYLLPFPYANMIAFLPFMVEDCFEAGTCKYLVTHIVEGFTHPTFVSGVEITHWNGTPIDRAVRNNAQRYAGSNPDARHARGVQNLTTRALRAGPPPDEDWVLVSYRTLAGLPAELRFDWVVSPTPDGAAGAALFRPGKAAALGIDIQQQIVQRARAALFAPRVKTKRRETIRKLERGERLDALETSIPHVLEAKPVDTKAGKFGYLRIRSFNVDPEQMISEVVRLISALPKRGLIIDVRGNGGGIIHSGEYLLQLFCPRLIEPEPVQFLNTPLNLRLCARNDASSPFADLSVWRESMAQALQTGSAFSAGFPISDPAMCNAIGQRYFGPVVLITDALCYSTTDIFAAGFQDHKIGPVIGTHRSTGAGGANVWQHDHLIDFVMAGEDSVYARLPRGAGMRVSMRRTLRVGPRAGMPVEDLGVAPDVRHELTKLDILEDNVDLKEVAGAQLAKLPERSLVVRATSRLKRGARLAITAKHMTRVDIYLDDRPIASKELKRGAADVDIESPAEHPIAVEVRGFDGSELVARHRVSWVELQGAVASAETKRKRPAKPRTTKREIDAATPNAQDDSAAAAELSFAAFAGPALTPVGAAAAPAPWRVAKSLKQLVNQVNTFAPARSKKSDGFVGDAAHQTRTSDHNPWVKDGATGVVTACDITHDVSHGCDADAIAEAIRASRDARVKYIIWNHRIANHAAIGGQPSWAWRPYTGANPHDKHVHISVMPEKASYDSDVPWSL